IYSFTTQAIQLYGTASNEIKGNVISTTSNVVKAIYITENTDNTTISNNTVQVGRIDISGGVDTQSNNSIMNNAFSSVSGVAINIGTNAADTYVSGNNLNSTGTISDFGTNTVYGGQQDSGANGNYIIDPSGTGVLEARGVIQLNMGTANTNTAVCYNSSNQLAGCTSASRYKDDVEALSLGLTELNLLQPVSYTWNTTGKQDVGFIAEQVAAVIPQAVEYNLDGEVSTFNYHTISALLVASTQELSVKVDGIDGRLASVENRLTVLEQSVANNPINLTVTQNLTVGANIVVGGKVITSGDAPTVTVHANAGDGADATVQGNDTSGVVTINSGTVNILTGEQVSIVFHDSYTAVPKITITPSTEFSAKVRYYVEQDQNGFRILFLDMPEVSKQYSFNYWIAQ
ncbi:tail fiber domain-containing protein, partial [Candidatus Saccharibacteria bacterium]|nr:tail fiber domain-containing protein [Candidatus Saccharibacteria bacterium]